MELVYWSFGVRHIQLFLLCGFFVIDYVLLHAMSAIVYTGTPNFESDPRTIYENSFRKTISTWTVVENISIFFSSTYFEYVGWLVSGIFTRKFNLKYLLLGFFFVSSVYAYATPHVAEHFGYWAMIALRSTQGFFHGALRPIANDIIVRWTPYNEICRSATMLVSVKYFGVSILLFLANFLQLNPRGWYTLFYLTGNLGFIWCVAWVVFGSDDPENCFYITEKEKSYIHSLSFQGAFSSKADNVATHMPNVPLLSPNTPKKSRRIPWADIMKCVPFHGYVLTEAMYSWFVIMVEEGRLIFHYITLVHKYEDKKKLSILYQVIPVLMPIIQYVAAFVVDYFTGKDIFPITYLRKTCNSIGLWGTSITMLYMAYSTDSDFQMTLFAFWTYFTVFAHLGMSLTPFDIAPNFVGVMTGISGFISRFPVAFVGVIILEYLPEDKIDSDPDYDNLFYWGSLSLFAGNFIYIMLANDDLQSFNFEEKDGDARDRAVSV